MNKTPRGNRMHIAFFGRRNAGKSSFMNRFLGQDYSIVSAEPGTTTDPVEKAYELQPVGPVVLIDTAGIDDEGDLGKKRVEKTLAVLKRADAAVLLCDQGAITPWEKDLVENFESQGVPFMVAITKRDLMRDTAHGLEERIGELKRLWNCPVTATETITGTGFNEAKTLLAELLQTADHAPPIIADLVKPGAPVILVIPIDQEAPRGRIILPQVQTIRELLDAGVPTISCRETELAQVLSFTGALDASAKDRPGVPQMVVTDSQAFAMVSKLVPEHIPLTSFSILFSRHKGDLASYLAGLKALETLKDNDTILIGELCSHRPVGEDIGRIKIPRWLREKTGKTLNFEVKSGRDWPADLSPYALIIQCGGCMVNRRCITSRITDALNQGIPITNYGLLIAHLTGITSHLQIFPGERNLA